MKKLYSGGALPILRPTPYVGRLNVVGDAPRTAWAEVHRETPFTGISLTRELYDAGGRVPENNGAAADTGNASCFAGDTLGPVPQS